jgi:hypothetical protein
MRWLLLCWVWLLPGVFACAPEDDAPLPFDNGRASLVCVPGEQRECACPGSATGVQVCDGDGQRLLPCDCGDAPSGSCTLFPDCRGCVRCFETCICHGQGDVQGCSRTCGLTDAGVDSGADSGVLACTLSGPCAPPPRSTAGCCTAEGRCGLILPNPSPQCVELNQPGSLDSECPSLEAPGFNLPGCCRPDGRCGVFESVLPLGCISRDALTPDASTSCTPNAS